MGVTFAFLISSPLVDAVTVAMFAGMFGLRTTLIYVGSGIVLSMVAGFVLGKMNLEPLLTELLRFEPYTQSPDLAALEPAPAVTFGLTI